MSQGSIFHVFFIYLCLGWFGGAWKSNLACNNAMSITPTDWSRCAEFVWNESAITPGSTNCRWPLWGAPGPWSSPCSSRHKKADDVETHQSGSYPKDFLWVEFVISQYNIFVAVSTLPVKWLMYNWLWKKLPKDRWQHITRVMSI